MEDLMKIKKGKKMGTYLFNALYMLDPISDENAIFKEKWFKYFKISGDGKHILRHEDKVKLPIGHCFMSLDGATSEGKNDYSAIVITTTDTEKNIYVLETWAKQVDPIKLIDKIIEIYFKWGCIKLATQKSLIEKMLMSYMKERMQKEEFWINFHPLKENTRSNKEYEIQGLQPWYQGGSIYHLDGMRGGRLEEELLRFPKARYDDLSDALQMQKEIIFKSPHKVVSSSYDRNSLHSWKNRLKRIFDDRDTFHIGGSVDYTVNERTY